MWATEQVPLRRYQRQMVLPALGLAAQKRLAAGRVLVVGVGGIGTWAAELLARAGVGFLRLVDDDRVELTNIHRQALYGESEAAGLLSKPAAAARRLGEINGQTVVEPIETRLDRHNIAGLAGDVDMILDGTDNWPSRFLINDFAVKHGKAWVLAGAVGTEAQTMVIIPGRTPCLRCVLDCPPETCTADCCRTAGVLGPAVAAIAAFQAAEAIKILAGRPEAVNPNLLKFDVWRNTVQQMCLQRPAGASACVCCGEKEYEFLEP